MHSPLLHPTRPVLRAAVLGARALRAIAFWLSVALALAYPIVFGIVDTAFVDQTMIVGIVALHAVTIVIGHGYHPRPDS